MKKAYILLLITAMFASCFAGCEDQEDTWAEYAGNGRIRYTGICTDVELKLGWEEATLSWKNTLDPNREHVQIEWVGGDVTGDTLLNKDAESCVIAGLGNATYTFRVYAIDKDNRRSLGTEVYGRPYTMMHEALNGFTPVITKWFPLDNDKLVLFFDSWPKTLAEAQLLYYKKSAPEELISLKLTGADSILKKQFYLVEDIDVNKDVVVKRIGQLDELPGVNVDFGPRYLDIRQRTFNSDFVREVQTHLFAQELDNDFIESVEELEFDYDMISLEDVLYFPNLKKISLGKNRYLYPGYENAVKQSILSDTAKSRFALQVLHSMKNVKVERYNCHYFTNSFSGMEEKGNPDRAALDALNYFTATSIVATPVDQSGFNPHAELLLDNDQSTIWMPQQTPAFRMHELLIDLGEVRSVAGFKVVQDATSPINSKYDSKHYYRPNLMKVEVSENQAEWEGAMFDEDNEIGNTAGEITLLRMQHPKNIRYIKITVSDLAYYTNFNIVLADFVVFGE